MANLNVQKFQNGNKEFHLLANYDGMPVSDDQFDAYKRSLGVTEKQQQSINMVKFGDRVINLAALKTDMNMGRAFVCSKYQLTEEELNEFLKQQKSTKR